MAVLDAMPSSNLRPEDDSEVEANRVYRTTYMFSATMPPSVERLARKCAARCCALGFRVSWACPALPTCSPPPCRPAWSAWRAGAPQWQP